MWSIRSSTWGKGIVWTRRSGAPSCAYAVLVSSVSASSRKSEQYRMVRSPASYTRDVAASLSRWSIGHLRPRQLQRHGLRTSPSITATPWCRYATWALPRASGGDL